MTFDTYIFFRRAVQQSLTIHVCCFRNRHLNFNICIFMLENSANSFFMAEGWTIFLFRKPIRQKAKIKCIKYPKFFSLFFIIRQKRLFYLLNPVLETHPKSTILTFGKELIPSFGLTQFYHLEILMMALENDFIDCKSIFNNNLRSTRSHLAL